MRVLTGLCAAVLSLLTGCAAQRGPMLQLDRDDSFRVEYTGAVGAGVQAPSVREFEPGAKAGRLIELEARILRLTAAQANQLVSDPGVIGAAGIESAKADELVQQAKAIGGTLVSAPRVAAYLDQSATISVINGTAYISAFEIKGDKGARIADPVVSTVVDGLLLAMKVRQTKGELGLELEVAMAETVKPIPTRSVTVFGSSMTIQTPTTFTQKISVSGSVDPKRVLVLTGLVGQGNDVVIVLVKTTPKDK